MFDLYVLEHKLFGVAFRVSATCNVKVVERRAPVNRALIKLSNVHPSILVAFPSGLG